VEGAHRDHVHRVHLHDQPGLRVRRCHGPVLQRVPRHHPVEALLEPGLRVAVVGEAVAEVVRSARR
jgi:hypothetical protein